MTENEKHFIRTVVDFDSKLNTVQTYLKDEYDIDSIYNEDLQELRLISDDTISLIEGKRIVNEEFTDNLINVIF